MICPSKEEFIEMMGTLLCAHDGGQACSSSCCLCTLQRRSKSSNLLSVLATQSVDSNPCSRVEASTRCKGTCDVLEATDALCPPAPPPAYKPPPPPEMEPLVLVERASRSMTVGPIGALGGWRGESIFIIPMRRPVKASHRCVSKASTEITQCRWPA